MNNHLFFRPEAGLLLTLGDAQAMFPFVRPNTDDAMLQSLGLYRLVQRGEPPAVGRHELLVEQAPEFVDGQYVRRYVVAPMFPCDTDVHGVVLTVAEQKARFDADRLAEAKLAALAAVDAGLADALAAGMKLDGRGVIDLDDAAALLRHEVSISYFGADSMPLFLRGGDEITLKEAEFFGVMSDAARRRVALHQRRADLRALIEAALTEDDLRGLDLVVRA